MKNNPSALLMTLLFVVSAGGFACDFARLQIIRKAGGLVGLWMPWNSSAEVRRVRKELGDSPAGKRIDMFGRISTFAWIASLLIIAFWRFS
jgi:hypothetical protein